MRRAGVQRIYVALSDVFCQNQGTQPLQLVSLADFSVRHLTAASGGGAGMSLAMPAARACTGSAAFSSATRNVTAHSPFGSRAASAAHVFWRNSCSGSSAASRMTPQSSPGGSVTPHQLLGAASRYFAVTPAARQLSTSAAHSMRGMAGSQLRFSQTAARGFATRAAQRKQPGASGGWRDSPTQQALYLVSMLCS